MNNRLKQFLAAENITQSQFADKIEVVRASVSHVLSGRNNPSYDFIKAIMANYPSLNMEWLIFGKGKMYKGADEVHSQSHVEAASHALPVAEFHEELLFNDLYADDDSPAEQEDTSEEPELSPADATVPLSLLKTLAHTSQSVDKQRKVAKIIVLFDDGTYQEL